MTKFDSLQSSSVKLVVFLFFLHSSACLISALHTPVQLRGALSLRNETILSGANPHPALLSKVNSLKGNSTNVNSPKVDWSSVDSSKADSSKVTSSVSDRHENEFNTHRNATTGDLRPLHRSVRSPRKARKQRSSSPKRKVKRLVLRIENFPFLKLFSTRKLIRKRFVRRNVRSGSSRFNRRKFKVR